MSWLSPQEIAEARLSGTVGDTMGYDYIDFHGQPALTPMQGRVIRVDHPGASTYTRCHCHYQ